MILAGTNYLLIYSAIIGNFKKLFTNTEFLWYVSFILIFVIVTSFSIYNFVDLQQTFEHPEIFGKLESSFSMLFQIVAIITTTGFVTADFAGWTPFLTMLFFD